MFAGRWKQVVIAAVLVPLVPVFALLTALRGAILSRRTQQPLLLSFSQVIYDDVWQRPQEHAVLSSRTLDAIYCSPVQIHDWLFRLKRRWKSVQVFPSKSHCLVVLSPLVLSGHFKSWWIFRLNSWLMAVQTRPWLGSRPVIAVTNTPFGWPYLKDLFYRGSQRSRQAARITYDVIDDFPSFAWAPDFGRRLELEMESRVDAVLTGTQELALTRPQATYVPCGVHYELFATPQAAPQELQGLQRPIIGYFGTISERIDLDLIQELADAFPNASVVLVGPVHFPPARMPVSENLYYFGLQPHHRIPGFAQAFDVGLIPFLVGPATVALHPVKTLEYLAAGVPVVSTDLPEVRRFYSGIVRIGTDRNSFLKAVREALEDGNMSRRVAGQELAYGFSWQAMADKMNAVIIPQTLELKSSLPERFREARS